MNTSNDHSALKAVAAIIACMAASPVIPAETTPNIVVILTDDQGFADLGIQRQEDDVRTPHIDALAASGVNCTAGYITAPQCSPSRAGLLTGRYQQRFGMDSIPDCPLPLEELTIAERLRDAGYRTGMVGKWHLDPNVVARRWIAENLPDQAGKPRGRIRIPDAARIKYSPAAQGFDEFFAGEMNRYWANFDTRGNSLAPSGQFLQSAGRYRIAVKGDAAVAFIERNHRAPFFLYLAFMAPHTPLDAPREYLDRFPGKMPTRRRYGLAMLSAIDDVVGRVVTTLRSKSVEERTLIFFLSDNGAPIHNRRDSPVDTDMGGWDGSLNTPWIGEKGMLSEGGIRVPFIVRWKDTLPSGVVYDQPVSSLDIAATAASVAGLQADAQLDGVDLIPFLVGHRRQAPHDALFWRFWTQTAVRCGKWKYLQAGDAGEFLFDLSSDAHEADNLIDKHPETARRLRARLNQWTEQLVPTGIPTTPMNIQERRWYQNYFDITMETPRK